MMLPQQFDGWLWLLLSLGPLLLFQRKLHTLIQSVLLLLTRRIDLTTIIFSLLFFPGVLLHEMSHYVMARILRVRTGKISLIPLVTSNGRLRLGYVETEASDPIRETLIGAAPLLTGGAFVAFAGIYQMGLGGVWSLFQTLGYRPALQALPGVWRQPDFWLWFYLLFTVSSTMLPSSSDRRSWSSILLWLGILLGISLFAGAGPWLMVNAAPVIDYALTSAAVVFFISDLVHAILLIPFWLLYVLLSRVTGLEVK